MKIVLPYLRYVVVKYDFLKHFAFTIYSGLPLKLSFFFRLSRMKNGALCFVQWNLFDFQFNLQNDWVYPCAWPNLSFAVFLSIETGPC